MSIQQIKVPGQLEQVEAISRFVEDVATEAGFDQRVSYACQLAIAEVCENVIIHGYRGEEPGDIEILASFEAGSLSFEIRDTAPPFDPTRNYQPQEWDCRDPPVGGLGMTIINRVMDKVEYTRSGAYNVLKLLKTSVAQST